MADFLQILVTSAAAGSVYGLVALAYLLILRPSGIINFAVGEWATVGMASLELVTNEIEVSLVRVRNDSAFVADDVGGKFAVVATT